MWLFLSEWEFHISKIKVFNLSNPRSRGSFFPNACNPQAKNLHYQGSFESFPLFPRGKKNTTLVPQKFQGLTNPMASPWWTTKIKGIAAWLTFLVEFLIILGRSPPADMDHTKPFRREVVDAGLFGPIRSLRAGERARYLRKMRPKSTWKSVDFRRKNESSSDFWE